MGWENEGFETGMEVSFQSHKALSDFYTCPKIKDPKLLAPTGKAMVDHLLSKPL
jgi:hypothetical protein